MQKAIEVIQEHIALLRSVVHTAIKNYHQDLEHYAGAPVSDTQLSESAIKDMERLTEAHIADYQSAIKHLQRPKVKKDPRTDGLPSEGIDLLIYPKAKPPFVGRYEKGVNVWRNDTGSGFSDDYGVYYETDDILFYADPNEIQ